MNANYYTLLNIPNDAVPALIRKAFLNRIRTCHPDKEGGSNSEAKQLIEAYSVLMNPETRARFDAWLSTLSRDLHCFTTI